MSSLGIEPMKSALLINVPPLELAKLKNNHILDIIRNIQTLFHSYSCTLPLGTVTETSCDLFERKH